MAKFIFGEDSWRRKRKAYNGRGSVQLATGAAVNIDSIIL